MKIPHSRCLCSLICLASLLAGCASHRTKEPAVREEGWIGGRYKCAKPASWWHSDEDNCVFDLPPDVKRIQKSAIFTAELATNTPAYQAGIRPGDLILEFNGRPATDLIGFNEAICAVKAGFVAPVKIWREGKVSERFVTVGREKFNYRGTFAAGIGFPLPGFWDPPQFIPTRNAPEFSLVALGWARNTSPPVDFTSLEQCYRESCHPKDKPHGDDEAWHCWLTFFEISKGKTILAQETVPAKAHSSRVSANGDNIKTSKRLPLTFK